MVPANRGKKKSTIRRSRAASLGGRDGRDFHPPRPLGSGPEPAVRVLFAEAKNRLHREMAEGRSMVELNNASRKTG